MSAPAPPLLLERELVRWSRADGSAAVWEANRVVKVRRGALGQWSTLGRVGTIEEARKLLAKEGGGWKQRGGLAGVLPTRHARVPASPALAYYAGKADVAGVWVDDGSRGPSEAAKLARVAAYHLRLLERSGRPDDDDGRDPHCHGRRGLVTTGDRRQPLDEPPLTLGEVLAAIAHPDAPLTEPERRAALAELTTNEPLLGDNDDDDDC